MSEKKEKDVWMKEELNGCLKIKLENWKKEEFMSKKNLWSKQIKEMIWEGEEEFRSERMVKNKEWKKGFKNNQRKKLRIKECLKLKHWRKR